MAGLEAMLQRHRGPGRNLRERLLNGGQDVLWLAGLNQHLRDATRQRQAARLLFAVVRAVKNHLRGRQVVVGPQLAHKLVAVHGRHQDVGDHQIGPLGAHQGQRLGTVGGLQRLVAAVPDERDHQRPVGGKVINNKDLCHAQPVAFVSPQRARS